MKTLFALGTGVVLGTVAAIWLAARRELQDPGAPIASSEGGTATVGAIETPSMPPETLESEEAPQ